VRDDGPVSISDHTRSNRSALNAPSESGSLGRQVAKHLRSRIMQGEFSPGARLPSETEIALDYGVSRVTVRTAIKLLESQGLVDVRHGSGTFVSDFGTEIKAGIQELRSITETIREMGFEPSMERHKGESRAASEHESARLDLMPGEQVLDLQRAVFADGEVVAYSYDVIPIKTLDAQMLERMGQGSVFKVFETIGITPARAIAELHAVSSQEIAWGPQKPEQGLFLLLDQVHFDKDGKPFMYSKSYFVEGRFQFVILRTR
jgi:GntR family transcriptional regulator